MVLSYNEIAGRGLSRLTGLSDGIFAVAMTLLVFDLRSPEVDGVETNAQMLRALIRFAPQLILLAMSFLTLGIFWVGQQAQLHHLHRTDHHFAWIQIAFLFIVSLIPFSTRVLVAFFAFRLAIVLYWLNIVALGAILYASWAYAEHAGLVRDDAPAGLGAAIRTRIKLAQLLYGIGLALCVFHPAWSIAFFVIIQLGYACGVDLSRRSRLPEPEPADRA